MSFVIDQVRRIDAQLDRLQLSSAAAAAAAAASSSTSESQQSSSRIEPDSPRLNVLQSAIKSLSLSPSASRNPLLSARQIKHYLTHAAISSSTTSSSSSSSAAQDTRGEVKDDFERELEWLVVSKATAQIYGIVLNRLLDQTVSIADDIFYWDEVLNSRRWTAVYSVQTSPLRLYDWGSAVWTDVRRRAERFDLADMTGDARRGVTERWSEFYGLVREVVRERNVADMQKRVVSPVARVRAEVRAKQTELKKGRLRGANALGVLLGEGLMNESMHGEGLATPQGENGGHKWKTSVARNIALIDAVLTKVNEQSLGVDKFDAAIAEETDDDPLYEGENGSLDAVQVANRLIRTLDVRLVEYTKSTKELTSEHGRPSLLIRYWLPATVAILSSSTVLRILVNRKAEIVTWIEEFGSTIVDFWSNWVVEPTRKVIGTIRHDEGSEVSIMSKRSLEGDRDSLERMVVDFAVENPQHASNGSSSGPLTEAAIADIRAKVREGDLTPVLKAYEKDLASPFMGTVRGNLVRALLIQIQKTKVDIEVAMGGIDALLKSQELVFGFVGLTPGILVTVALGRWIRSSFSSNSSSEKSKKKGVMVRQLRNIDRVLSNSTPTDFGELYYKDHGLLLCEVHVLREEARKAMPRQVYREFLEEVEELVDVRNGVKRQREVVDRIRWAYGRFL